MKTLEYSELQKDFEQKEIERKEAAKAEKRKRRNERRKQRANGVDSKGLKVAVANYAFNDGDNDPAVFIIPDPQGVKDYEAKKSLDTSLHTTSQDAWIDNRASDKAFNEPEPVRTFEDEDGHDLHLEDGYVLDEGSDSSLDDDSRGSILDKSNADVEISDRPDDVPEDLKDILGEPDTDEEIVDESEEESDKDK